MTSISTASSEKEISDAARLFREYKAWLGLDLCFQGFEAELATLPGNMLHPTDDFFWLFPTGF